MEKCLFCQIAKKNLPAKVVYEDEEVLAFDDINPKAPIHLLIIPKKHIESIRELKPEDSAVMAKMILTAQKLAKEKGIESKGYRLVINTGSDSGQVVDHLHLHLLGGKNLSAMA